MPPKKKQKVEEKKGRWQVSLAGKWADFDAESNQKIEDAYNTGKASMELTQRGQKYVFTFADMKQTNTTTPPYKKRNVRRIEDDGSSSAPASPSADDNAGRSGSPTPAAAAADSSPPPTPAPPTPPTPPSPTSTPPAGGPDSSAASSAAASTESLADAPLPPREEATFTLVDVPNDCEEFWDLEERFNSCLQGRNEDYVSKRLEKKLKPVTFVLKGAQKIKNPILERRYAIKKAQMMKEITDKSVIRERLSFHGTHPKNVGNICKTSLLRFQHPMNPCKVQVDDGWFGTNKKGVYVSRYADYTFKYANRQAPLEPGEKCKIILFKTMPGRSKHIEKMVGPIDPTPGFDSHSSPSWLEWYLFDEDQALPDYVLEILAREDTRTAADDM